MLLVCLFGAAISLSLLPLVAAEPTTAATDLKKNTFLLLCLTDGSIYSLEAWTGDFQSVIYTDPLLQTNHHPDESSISDSNVIWPGLDGRLYWRPPVAVAASSSSSSSGVDSKDDSMHGRLPPRTPQLPPLQELPLTVSTLLENPVRSCDPDNHRDCGILTAQAVTSLLALSESGDLLWQSTGGGTESPPLSENSPGASILLQRKDYWVSNVRAESGRQSWNVSMGTYQALDFDLTSAEKENEYLLGNDDILNNKHNQQPLLPAIVFGNAGKTLTAVDPVTEAVLWRQDVPSTLAAVFGIHRGQWKTVQVLEDSETIAMSESPFLPVRRQLEGAAKDTTIISEYEQFLWHSQQQQQQNHWAPNRQELEPQTNRLTNQKALPGRTYTALEQQLDRANMCYVNGMKLEGSSCPNLNLPLPLGLPAPPAAVSEPTPPLVLPLEGLLLSWSLVTALVVVLMILTVGGLWYFREKITPAANGNAVQSSRRWHDCLSSAASEELTTTQMKRSNSLPGTLGGLRPETLPLKPVLRLQRSDDGSLILAKQKEQAVVNSSKPEESPKLTKQQQQQRQVVADFSSGIPIVHYPRYASEFQQLRALGKGGFGSVFQCKNTLDGRNYAVKKVTVRGSSYDGAFKQKMDRVLREVKILAVLDHPNIVRYYAAWVEHIDDQANDGHTSEHYEDTYTYDSESMSQLCRDNFSSSDGEPSRLVHGGNRLSNHRHHETDNNPLGWNRGVDSSEELSSLPRRRSLLSKDVLTIFEESNEDREPSCADARKISYTALRSNNIDTISRRPLMDDEHSLSDRSITVAESLQTSPPRIQRNDRTAVTKHILFIQMQLCSQKTVAEFLTDLESRRGPITDTTVDIPKALRLFLQVFHLIVAEQVKRNVSTYPS